MLPTVPLPSTKLTVEDTLQLQPVRPTTQVIDVLSEFVPGQKLVALIQMQLANGAYRATIAQRDVTLALPFSAKPGDALDLEVVQTEGRIAFAVSKPPPGAEAPATSATTTLSRAGQLIGQLLSLDRPTGKDTAVVLAGNRAILADPAVEAPAAQASALQRAVVQSGLFYESHQASWLAGKLPEANLRAEPQGTFGRGPPPSPGGAPGAPAGPDQPVTRATSPGVAETHSPPAAPPLAGETGAPRPAPGRRPAVDSTAAAQATVDSGAAPAAGSETAKAAAARAGVAAELAPLVQQQLTSLAGNLYAFQGMIWPGQPFHWEIVDEDGGRPARQEGEPERPWKTRLKLLLPSLGDIDASVELAGSEVTIQMTAGRDGTPQALHAGATRLRERMELAGLRLLALDIRAAEPPAERSDA